MDLPKCAITVTAAWLLMTFAGDALAANYYLNQKTGSDGNDGSKERPWKTLDALEWFEFVPGDTVYFARGSKWKGGFAIDSNGTAQAPILFTAYGEGDAPILTNPDNREFNGNCIRVRGDHVTIEKLRFHETSDARGLRGRGAIFNIGAVYVAKGAGLRHHPRLRVHRLPEGREHFRGTGEDHPQQVPPLRSILNRRMVGPDRHLSSVGLPRDLL